MTLRRTIAAVVLGLPLIAAAVAGGGWLWAQSARDARLDATFSVPPTDFPVPFPLTEAEIEALRAERLAAAVPAAELPGNAPEEVVDEAPADPMAGVDLNAVATERAVARGKHLVDSRYFCSACHGEDLGGGTMIDAPPMGKILGRNLTSGAGGVVGSYTVADWSSLVRHGVKPDGRPTVMPSGDYLQMSNRELSDIIAFIRSLPPVDRDVPPPTWGPIGTMLLATRQLRLTAEDAAHDVAHAAEPPSPGDTLAFGKHLSATCRGCHGPEFAGGPIVGGDPAWLPAANLTPTGLAGWTYEEFVAVMREGQKKSGGGVGVPMNEIIPWTRRASDEELSAMWAYLQTVPPAPTPQ